VELSEKPVAQVKHTADEINAPKLPGVLASSVHWVAYWPEWLLLLASVLAPTFVAMHYQEAHLFARAGALTVFFAATAQFFSIGRANTKHLRNARRAKDNQSPRDFSSAAKVISWLSFFCGLLGTIIWAYGDML
jgi:hypothetical protein